MDENEAVEIRSITADLLRDSAAAHKRRCAIAHGVREASEIVCDHADWNCLKHWCNNCGTTEQELVVTRA